MNMKALIWYLWNHVLYRQVYSSGAISEPPGVGD